MSSGMFRGKESSNRIKLSRLVQDLLDFGVLGSLQLWGWGWLDGGVQWLGVPPHTCTCTHMHACTWTRGKHDNFMQMATPIWGKPWEFPMMSYTHTRVCACVCAHACVCVWGAPSHHPHPHPPTPTPGGPQNQSKFNST